MQIRIAACAAAVCLFVSSGAFAFDAATPDALPKAGASKAAPDPGDAGARSAKSIECSQNADAKDLHGKPRKHFMHECKHAE